MVKNHGKTLSPAAEAFRYFLLEQAQTHLAAPGQRRPHRQVTASLRRYCAAMTPEVLISEVGPRDGLQSVKSTMPTAAKCAWIDALVAAGLREIEVASFVPARLLPQMADAADVVRHARRHTGVTVLALVPNLKGAEAAIEAGAHKLTIPVSASAAHLMANVRKTPEQMLAEVHTIVALRNAHAPQVGIEVGVSTAFGCTIQGEVPEDDVVRLAEQLAEAGVDDIGLVRHHRLWPIRRRCGGCSSACARAIGDKTGAAHLHNTRGLGLANCLAAYDVGVRAFDASLGGLGGCPFAPGASRQRGHRGPGVHVRGHGRAHRHRSAATDRGARAAARRACRVSRSTA